LLQYNINFPTPVIPCVSCFIPTTRCGAHLSYSFYLPFPPHPSKLFLSILPSVSPPTSPPHGRSNGGRTPCCSCPFPAPSAAATAGGRDNSSSTILEGRWGIEGALSGEQGEGAQGGPISQAAMPAQVGGDTHPCPPASEQLRRLLHRAGEEEGDDGDLHGARARGRFDSTATSTSSGFRAPPRPPLLPRFGSYAHLLVRSLEAAPA
jgi:hypothetical protein